MWTVRKDERPPIAQQLITTNLAFFQRVGLKKFPKSFLNSRPAILVSAWYAGRSDCPSAFDFSVELTRGGRTEEEVLYFWSASGSPRQPSDGYIDANQMLPTIQGEWTKVEHLITDYPEDVEEIKVTLTGIAGRVWSGWYGAKFTAVEVRFVPPREIRKYRQKEAARLG